MTWFCKLVRLRTGGFVTSIQFVELKLKFCCSTKFVEGMSHENARLDCIGVMFNRGHGVVCEIQIPPFRAAATSLLPSAEVATEIQFVLGALAAVQLSPKLVEI